MATTARGPGAAASVAVVGAGPAGLYLLAALVDADLADRFDRFDVYEATPAPFGLIRYGVAPDHPRTRAITRVLVPAFDDPRVRYRGNVDVGSDVTLDELRAAYDAVVISTGMRGDRSLGIPGEHLPGSLGSSELVAWYTGHPTASVRALPEADSVAVIGAGNVALDVARIVTRDPSDLASTTMPRHVVDRFAAYTATDTHLFARRGPAVAKFTSPELHELGKLEGVAVVVDPADLELSDDDKALVESDRRARVIVDLLRSWADAGPTPGARRRIHIHFHRRPTRILGQDGITGIEVESTRGDPRTETFDVQLVVRAIGYDTPPFPGLPYDESRHIVPTSAGRVLLADGTVLPRVYVTGWLRRGPSGVIGTNRPDAAEVAGSIVADLDTGDSGTGDGPAGTPDDVDRLLAERGIDVFGWGDWLGLDTYEHALGADLGIDAVVVHDLATMLARRWRS